MILNQKVEDWVTNIKNDMVRGQSGTGTTLFDKTQTGLITAVSATDLSLSDRTSTDRTIFVTHVITTSVGNGSTLTEFEVNNTIISFNRSVKAPLSKTAQIEYNIFHTFDFVVTADDVI